MEITSFHFLLFVLGTLIVYHLLSHRVQNQWLLIASYAFYIFWSWKFSILLLFSTIFHFELARHLRKDEQGRPVLLWLGIGANIILFMIFKASSFYVPRLDNLLDQFGVQRGFGALQIVIPLGLSYYVLQQISYLIDVYRGQMPAASNRVDFALYLAYFPKMVAGPIERARTFLPMLARPRKVDNEAVTRSFGLIIVGLIRKLLIANLLFAYLPWDALINAPSTLSKMELVIWLSVYAFGLYNDFAGYTNIVRGVSGLFGIELSANFNVPYISRSFTEFWNRWHISLSQWLRDYIFFPTSRVLARRFPNRNAWQNLVLPSIITMLVSGFWHKPNWQMLLWGGMHAAYLVLERLLGVWHPDWVQGRKGPVLNWVSTGVVFLLVSLAWVPFFLGLDSAVRFWNALLTTRVIGVADTRIVYAMFVLLLAVGLDWVQTRKTSEIFFLQYRSIVQAALLATVIVLLLIVSAAEGQPFIYQGF
jgi:D-alanyl-lipoteichoic acid acyltransferase DltB (MBOAT superfamily)